MLDIASALETAQGTFELQQQGEKLVKRLKGMREEQGKKIQSQIDMLKQERKEAMQRVRAIANNNLGESIPYRTQTSNSPNA